MNPITCDVYDLKITQTRSFDLLVTGTDGKTYSLLPKFPLDPKAIELVKKFFKKNAELWPDSQFQFLADPLDRITEILD